MTFIAFKTGSMWNYWSPIANLGSFTRDCGLVIRSTEESVALGWAPKDPKTISTPNDPNMPPPQKKISRALSGLIRHASSTVDLFYPRAGGLIRHASSTVDLFYPRAGS